MAFKLFLICVSFLAIAAKLEAAKAPVELSPIVQLKGGKVQGFVQEVPDEGHVYAYYGIRYGRAERFAKPKPVEPWTDVHNATSYNFACPQRNIPFSEKVVHGPGMETIVSNEDCLFVSVWQPMTKSDKPRSVLVWVHGGAFTMGTVFSQYYDGRYIALLGDVVVVTVNYRLDAFGFLYGGTADAPGNAGLQDQLLALKWVQENIANFGGDPKSVTLHGESAGSFSVGALTLSPLTKGLYRRAILQSGAPNSYLGSHEPKRGIEITKLLAERLHCQNDDMEKIIACLKSKTVNEILEGTAKAQQNGEDFIPIWGDDLMPIRPVEALKSGKFNTDVDLMYGVTKNEGSMFVVNIFNFPQLDPANDGHDMTVDVTKQIISFMMSIFKDSNPQEVADFYTKNLNNTDKDELRRAVSYVFGDYHLVCPTMFYGQEFIKHAPQNRYYSYRLMKNTLTPVMFCRGWMGVCHAEDVVYLFGIPLRLRGTAFTDEEAQLSRDFISTWTNFAKTGHPGKLGAIEWEEAVVNRADLKDVATRFVELYPNRYRMVSDYFKETCNAFWKPRLFV